MKNLRKKIKKYYEMADTGDVGEDGRLYDKEGNCIQYEFVQLEKSILQEFGISWYKVKEDGWDPYFFIEKLEKEVKYVFISK
jgi:hypothetical protein